MPTPTLEQLTEHLRNLWKKVQTIEKIVEELKNAPASAAVSGVSPVEPNRKRYIEASFSDWIKVKPEDQPRWFGVKSGIEIDADITPEELAKVVETQQRQVDFFVNKGMKTWVAKNHEKKGE